MFTKFEEEKKMLGPKSVVCAASISCAVFEDFTVNSNI